MAQTDIQIAGACNFRDLGGYQTHDGKRVRKGIVYRSGNLSRLTDEGCLAIGALGLRGLCDLRTSRERQHQRNAWQDALNLDCWFRDYETSFGELRALLECGDMSEMQARNAMITGYRSLPFEQGPAYREIFRRLVKKETPLVFFCSAGKDRTGVAAALLLTALGVPRQTVLQDYTLTSTLADLEQEIVQRAKGAGTLSSQSPEVIRAILGCDPRYIEAMLDTVASSGNSFDIYLKDTLLIDASSLSVIKDHLLE